MTGDAGRRAGREHLGRGGAAARHRDRGARGDHRRAAGARGRGRVRRGRDHDPRRGRAGGEGDEPHRRAGAGAHASSASRSRRDPTGSWCAAARRRARTLKSHGDHRIAMCAAVAGLARGGRDDGARLARGRDLVPRLRSRPRDAAGGCRERSASWRSTVRRARGSRPSAAASPRRSELHVLDTGAMYRSVTLAALEAGVDLTDAVVCGRIAHDARRRARGRDRPARRPGRERADPRPGGHRARCRPSRRIPRSGGSS